MSLRGRIETRIFLIVTVGLVWTLAVTVVSRPAALRSNLTVLALTGACGLVWELGYHALQQLRWDKDWPSVFGVVTVLNEGALLWALAGAWPWLRVDRGSALSFAALVGSTWLVMWLFVQGPMRVVFLRWRLQGGRILCPR